MRMVAVRARAWGVAALESLVLLVYLAAMPSPRWWVCPACGLYAAANIALTLVVAVILTVMGRWRSIGFRAPRRRRALLYFLVPFLPVILNVAPGLQFTGAAEVTGLLLFALMVGFVEDSSVPRSDAAPATPLLRWLVAGVVPLLRRRPDARGPPCARQGR